MKITQNNRTLAIKKVEHAGHKVYDLGKGKGFKVAHYRQFTHYYTDREFFNFASCFGDGKPVNSALRIVKKNSKGINRTQERNILHKSLNSGDFDGAENLPHFQNPRKANGKGDEWGYD